MTEASKDQNSIVPQVGQKMADGSIFAGMTADGKHQIYVMPKDLNILKTFNNAAKAVKKLNDSRALGHDDWQIPSRKNLRVLYKSRNEGALAGTFRTSANSPDFSLMYWSSTRFRHHVNSVFATRFSNGSDDWVRRDTDRLSCRLVRLVEVSAAPKL